MALITKIKEGGTPEKWEIEVYEWDSYERIEWNTGV